MDMKTREYESNPFYHLACPILALINYVLENKEDDDQSIRETFKKAFFDFESKALVASLNHDDISLVKYALVALVDEIMSGLNNTIQTAWIKQPLQRLWYGEHTAGEGFYEKLNAVRLTSNVEVIEIYYICLLVGFKGRLRFEDITERQVLMDQICIQLSRLSNLNDLDCTADDEPAKKSTIDIKGSAAKLSLICIGGMSLIYSCFYIAISIKIM